MKLYHYITKGNNALEKGILSFAENPKAELSYYEKRSGSSTHEGIVRWMESCFKGRSRGIRGFSEPVKWHSGSLSLKVFIENSDLFSIDITALEQDGLIEAVYCSPPGAPVNPSEIKTGTDEELIKLGSINEIDRSPVDWSRCNDELGLRFYVVPYYVIVVKGGVIPVRYITLTDS